MTPSRMSGHMGFVVDKVALAHVVSKYFSLPCQFSFHQLLHIHLSSCHRRYIVSTLTASLNNTNPFNKTDKFNEHFPSGVSIKTPHVLQYVPAILHALPGHHPSFDDTITSLNSTERISCSLSLILRHVPRSLPLLV
jgi:hypothetical protein